MALSTNKPVAKAIPPRDIILRLMPLPYIMLKVAITETGIDSEIMSVGIIERKKRYKINIANKPPINAADFTSLMALEIKVD